MTLPFINTWTLEGCCRGTNWPNSVAFISPNCPKEQGGLRRGMKMGEWPKSGAVRTHHLLIKFVILRGSLWDPKTITIVEYQWSLITEHHNTHRNSEKVWNTVELPKHDWDVNWANAVGNMALTDLLNRVATNLQFVKINKQNTVSVKYIKAKHSKTRHTWR